MIGAGAYLIAFVGASLVPIVDHRTFSGLLAVLLAWPWVDYLPAKASGWLLIGCVLLNAVIIYVAIALVAQVASILSRKRL
jgi:hypothetical protein